MRHRRRKEEYRKYMSKKIVNRQTKDTPRKKTWHPHTTIYNMGAYPGSQN